MSQFAYFTNFSQSLYFQITIIFHPILCKAVVSKWNVGGLRLLQAPQSPEEMGGEAKNRNFSHNTFLNAQSVSLGPNVTSLHLIVLPDDYLLFEEGGNIGFHENLLLFPNGVLVRVPEVEGVVFPVVVVHPLIEMVSDVKASVVI